MVESVAPRNVGHRRGTVEQHRGVPGAPDDVEIRPRVDDDLDACVELVDVVHVMDGYPPYLSPGGVEPFLVTPDALAAWVALLDGAVVGHVALHRGASASVLAAAEAATGLSVERLGVVARLFVAPHARRLGIGLRLLDVAVEAAVGRGRRPVLDVWVELAGAVALYESAGWQRVATVVFVAPDGERFDEHVYVAPDDS
jgi:GNAT superfamily N-acetyltransferase